MSIKKADSAGFCFGVNRAINIVNELLKKGIKVATLGPIIHNMEMVHELEEKGCTPVESVDELSNDTTFTNSGATTFKKVVTTCLSFESCFRSAVVLPNPVLNVTNINSIKSERTNRIILKFFFYQ